MNNYKKILITGADGFIGSHLAEKMVQSGFDVTATSIYNFNNNFGWLEHIDPYVKKNINIISCDIRDFSQINNIIKKKEVVYHLAALIGIPYSYQAVKSYIDTNIIGTYNILEGCKNNNVKKVFMTSTSEVYGSARFKLINEDHPLQAQSPYSASKISSDALAYAYYCSYNLPINILRPFNVFGPRQSLRAVIPTIILQLLKGNTINLGNVFTTRDFNYVEDTVDAFIKAIKIKDFGEIYNIGTGINFSIEEICELIASELSIKNFKIKLQNFRSRPEKSEVVNLVSDTNKFKKKFKWESSIKNKKTLKERLKQTTNWYKNNKNLSLFKKENFSK